MIFFGKLFMGQNTHIQYNNHLLPSENIYCLGNVYPLTISTDAISTNEYSVRWGVMEGFCFLIPVI